MRNLSTNRANISTAGINILKKLVFKDTEINENNITEEQHVHEINNQTPNEHALGLLYKNLHDNSSKQPRKPFVYFIIGFIAGVLSVLFLSAVVFVSDKDTIESDVKAVKENIIENEKIKETETTVNVPTENTVENVFTTDENGAKVYVVKEGDTLGGIVNRIYGDSSTYQPEKVAKFKEVNGMKSANVLKIGQKLIIPD